MYEGKVTVDLSQVDDLTRKYLVEFKEKLNEHIEKIRKSKKKKQPQGTNSDYHARMVNGGR